MLQGSLVISPGKTLKRQFDEVIGELETWKRKRETRVSEYDSIQTSINEIRESMGMTTVCTKKVKNSITKSNMDFLKLELERMRGEKVCALQCLLLLRSDWWAYWPLCSQQAWSLPGYGFCIFSDEQLQLSTAAPA